MNDESIEQVPGGYYYQPYLDDGWWSENLSDLAEQLAGSIDYGNPIVDVVAPEFASLGGREAGWLVDNFQALKSNFNTLINQLNDWKSWQDPTASFWDR